MTASHPAVAWTLVSLIPANPSVLIRNLGLMWLQGECDHKRFWTTGMERRLSR